MSEIFHIVDANNAVHRFTHGMPYLSSKDGVPTHGITGFLRYLWRIEDTFGKDLLIVFDSPNGSSWRKELLGSYKEEREKDETVSVQLDILRELCVDMGYEVYCHDGAEADDVMYTLSRRGNCFIFSHDKDMNYAINDKCRVIRVSDSSWKITTDIEVFAKYGIWPNEMPLFLALSGDSSDGVKGLNGVGKVTAAKWIRKYRNFDAICSSTEFRKKHSGCESQLETFLRVCTPQITDLILNRKIDPNYSVVNRVLMGLGMVSTAAEYRKREGFQLKFELPD